MAELKQQPAADGHRAEQDDEYEVLDGPPMQIGREEQEQPAVEAAEPYGMVQDVHHNLFLFSKYAGKWFQGDGNFMRHRQMWLDNPHIPGGLEQLDQAGSLQWVRVIGRLQQAHIGGNSPIAAVGQHKSGAPSWVARTKYGMIGYAMVGTGCFIASWGAEHQEFEFWVLNTNHLHLRSPSDLLGNAVGQVPVGLEGQDQPPFKHDHLYCAICPAYEHGKRIAMIPGRAGQHIGRAGCPNNIFYGRHLLELQADSSRIGEVLISCGDSQSLQRGDEQCNLQ